MTPAAHIEAILELLTEIETKNRPADTIAQQFFRSRRYIGSKDRRAIADQLFDIYRHRARLGWWLNKLHTSLAPRPLVLAYLFLVENAKATDIEALFSGGRFAPDELNEDEQKILRRLKGHTLFHPDMPQADSLECPLWAYESLSKRFGNNIQEECEALLSPAPLDLRVNVLKSSRDDALKALTASNIKAVPTPFSPLGIRIHNRLALGNLALLKEGAIEIQDEGSQLIALLLNPQSGERICDFCAGAGGKTLAIAAQMNNKGRIVACDVLERRLKQSQKRFTRAGIHNIDIHPLKSERDPWVKRQKGKFDRVLVDAPCSGSGTWRRSPNARWDGLGPNLETLLPLQKSILESAARLVKEKGRLVYATCSLLPEENEEQITRFLDNHPEFKRLPVQKAVPQGITLPDTGDYLALTPAQHKTDGFFAAVMERTGG
ncbi:MAG: RsmB/NOP family class I SAM-dependent RNA methyltransferase [Bdellovibrionales bacterium]